MRNLLNNMHVKIRSDFPSFNIEISSPHFTVSTPYVERIRVFPSYATGLFHFIKDNL